MQLNEYRSYFQNGNSPVGSVSGLCGRIIRGKKPEDFATLTDDPERKLVMLMGPDGLQTLLGKSGYDMLVAIGYDPDYLRHKVQEGNQFKLVVFPEGGPAKLAAWDNALNAAAVVYPEAADVLRMHSGTLKCTPFMQLQRAAGFTFLDVEKAGKSDPRFMTYDRFLKSNRTVTDVRAFLYFTVHLRELFSGDGYTYDDQGNRGMMEYIVPNKQLTELGAYELMDIAIVIPKNTQVKGVTPMTATTSKLQLLTLPPHYNAANARNANYQADANALMSAAAAWRKQNNLKPVGSDKLKIHVLNIDDQFDFDFPSGTLFVAGRSGTGAMDAAQRRVEFLYRYMGCITQQTNTMDSHLPTQIFSSSAHIDKNGDHPAPHTIISAADYKSGKYRPNPAFAAQIGADTLWLQRQITYYCEQLEKSGKYMLYIWPFHCLLGSPGHRLAGVTEEARLFHAFARGAKNNPEIKGGNPLTEHYSIFAPEVTSLFDGRAIPGAQKNTTLIKTLMDADRVFIMGEAASHCVKTSIADFLGELQAVDPKLAQKVVILRDCTTAVVVPGVADFTDDAERAIQNFQDAGMNVVESTDQARIEELILQS